MLGFLETSLKKSGLTAQMEIAYTLSKRVLSESWHEVSWHFSTCTENTVVLELDYQQCIEFLTQQTVAESQISCDAEAWQNLQPRAPSSPNSSGRNQIWRLLDQPRWQNKGEGGGTEGRGTLHTFAGSTSTQNPAAILFMATVSYTTKPLTCGYGRISPQQKVQAEMPMAFLCLSSPWCLRGHWTQTNCLRILKDGLSWYVAEASTPVFTVTVLAHGSQPFRL